MSLIHYAENKALPPFLVLRNGATLDETPEMVALLDGNLAHYATVIHNQLGKDVAEVAGAGAAVGLGAWLMAFTHCTLRKGINIIVEFSGLRDKLVGAHFCFTGERRIDYQIKFGRTPFGVARTAKALGIPVIAVSSCVGEGLEALYVEGIDTIFGIIPRADSIKALLKNGAINMERAHENISRLLSKSAA